MSVDPLLVKAVVAVAKNCDGANSQDGLGFNGTDTKFGKSLASTPSEAWSEAVQRQAWEMMQKYKGQILSAGIEFSEIEEPKETKAPKGIRCVDVREGKVLVFLPYGDPVYPKAGVNASWNRDLRGWLIPVNKHGMVLDWAKRNDIPVTDRAKAILTEAQLFATPTYGGQVIMIRGDMVVAFEYNPSLVDAIRTIPGRKYNAETKEWHIPTHSVTPLRKVAEQFNLFMSKDIERLPDIEISTEPTISVVDKSFAISFNYDAQLISEVRQMPGADWSAVKHAWLVPIESVEEVLAFAKTHSAKTTLEVEDLVTESESVREIVESSQAKDAQITVKGLNGEMLPFQRAGVAYAMKAMGWEYQNEDWVRTSNPVGGVLIGDEMGLGKTIQGLAVLQATKAFPAVIVCPASLKLNWKRELEKWIPNIKVKVLSGTSGVMPDADVYVINYDILSHWVEKFVSIKALVLDESHYVKNGQAQRSKASIRLSDKVDEGGVLLCLSGTPVVNVPLELLTQLRVIHRLEEFGGATVFRRQYGHSGRRALSTLNRKLRASCYVRRRKAEVLTELPPKRWSEVVVEGDPAIMREYKKAEADIIKYLTELAMKLAQDSGATTEEARNEAWKKALRARAAENLVAIATLKQLAAKAKMKVAGQWIEDFLSNDKKLVVFGWHRDVVDEIAVKFSNGIKIQGGITSERRQEAVDLFQNSDEQKVIACNIKAAGVGLTLTAASDVLFLEQGWTPSDMEQGADRCHRIGQTDSVTAWLMLTANTIDEDIAMLIHNKRAVVDKVIDGMTEDEQEESVAIELMMALAQRGIENAR